ncbi:MAG: hypothetical protein IPL83_00915 [Bdellovibrionales bacterium]|nr:hypothetical protein [Bdellovibrionales bacterium]
MNLTQIKSPETLITEIQAQIPTDIRNQYLKMLAEEFLQEIILKKDRVTLTADFEILSQELLKETQKIVREYGS